jgi:hypothetical protein
MSLKPEPNVTYPITAVATCIRCKRTLYFHATSRDAMPRGLQFAECPPGICAR